MDAIPQGYLNGSTTMSPLRGVDALVNPSSGEYLVLNPHCILPVSVYSIYRRLERNCDSNSNNNDNDAFFVVGNRNT